MKHSHISKRAMRVALMASSTLAMMSMHQSALANDYTLNGGAAVAFPNELTLAAGIFDLDVKVDSNDITSVIWGIYGTSFTGNLSATIDKNITAAGNGVVLDARFAGDGGDVTINGSGAVTSAAGAAIWALADTGAVTIDGLGGGIDGFTFGVLVNNNGSWLGNAAGGDVNIGQSTRLGPVSAAGSGIWVEQLANVTGDGDINIDASSVDAGAWGIRTLGWTGDTNIDVSGDINAGTGIYATSSTGDIDVTLGGDVNGTAFGVVLDSRFAGDGGDVSVTGTGKVESTAGAALWLLADTGDVTIDGFSEINAATWGILVNSNGTWSGANPGGDVNIGQNTTIGDIVSGSIGIQVAQLGNAVGDGDINITTGNVDSASSAVLTTAWTGDTKIDTTAGTISAGGFGIVHTATDGAAEITTADVKSTATSIWTATTGGDVKVDTTAGSVTSTTGYGVLHTSGAGNVDVRTADVTSLTTSVYTTTITGDNKVNTSAGDLKSGTWGIAAFTATGAVDVKANKIDSVNSAIWTANTTGDTSVETSGDITSTANFGIFSTSTTGDIKHNVASGDVTGFTDGINAISGAGGSIDIDIGAGSTVTGTVNGIEAITNLSGDINIDIASGATVQAQTYALATGNILGVATTSNKGTIKDTTDTGAASDAGGDAYWSYAGNGVLNNNAGGVVTGRVHSNGSLSFTMNNASGATWNAGTGVNGFGAAGDSINNAGLINIRNGVTGLTALDKLNNNAGGVIDMQYGEDADDVVNGILNFNANDGGTLKFDVDFAGASDGDDHTSYGAGKGDTIYTVAATPAGTTTVDLNTLNRSTQGNLIATSGSIALVNSGGSNLADPGLGGLATMVASDNYVFAGDPSTGAVKFMLVEDGNGGVYLQWAPNITADSLGGYLGGGGVAGAGGAPGGGLANPVSTGGAVNGAMGGLAGVGAGFGGGPGGGGVAGLIADAAASSAEQNGNCGISKDMLHGTYSTDSHAWMSGTGSRSEFDGGGNGWDAGTSIGIERDLGGNMGLGCGDVAMGAFGFLSKYANSHATGSSEGTSKGAGLYTKAASQNGLYASALGAVAWGDTDLTNAVFASTAQQDSLNYMATLALGYAAPVSESTSIDMRVFGSWARADGSAFTDSAGIVVDDTKADAWTVGAMIGLSNQMTDSTTAFVNLGAKWIYLDREATAFGITVSGASDTIVYSAEAGLTTAITESATFSLTGFGDLSTDAISYGGNMVLNFKL